MRTSKFSESQIVGMLREAESGVPVADVLRRHGVSKATFFKWRSKYAGASVPDVRRLRARAALPRSVTIARGCSTIQRGISRALWGAVAVSPGYTALRR